MRVFVDRVWSKADALAAAVAACGHRLVPAAEDAEVLLLDFPAGWRGERWLAARWGRESGRLVCAFPHGAAPIREFAGLVEPCPFVDAELVTGPGFVEAYGAMGYPVACHPVGWFLSELGSFRPAPVVEHLLFAPIHPNSGDGGRTGLTWAQELNLRALRAVIEYPASRTTIYRYGTWSANFGCVPYELPWWPAKLPTVVESSLLHHDSVRMIDMADAVLSFGTFAWLAVARGVPTVMMGQSEPPRDDWGNESQACTAAWEGYRADLRWPFDLDDGSFPDVLAAACVGGPDADRWKTRWVGEQLDPGSFCELLRRLLDERRPRVVQVNRAARRARRKKQKARR